MVVWYHKPAVQHTCQLQTTCVCLFEFLYSRGLKGGVEGRSFIWKVTSGNTDRSREARQGREGSQ